MKITRASHDEVFMVMARVASYRGSCDRKRVGAIITLNNRIIASGYNSAPPGKPTCDEIGHDLVNIGGRDSCVRTVHAEANAIAQLGKDARGGVLYTNTFPCFFCAKQILSAGIIRIVYDSDYYNDPRVNELLGEKLERTNVKLTLKELDDAWPIEL